MQVRLDECNRHCIRQPEATSAAARPPVSALASTNTANTSHAEHTPVADNPSPQAVAVQPNRGASHQGQRNADRPTWASRRHVHWRPATASSTGRDAATAVVGERTANVTTPAAEGVDKQPPATATRLPWNHTTNPGSISFPAGTLFPAGSDPRQGTPKRGLNAQDRLASTALPTAPARGIDVTARPSSGADNRRAARQQSQSHRISGSASATDLATRLRQDREQAMRRIAEASASARQAASAGTAAADHRTAFASAAQRLNSASSRRSCGAAATAHGVVRQRCIALVQRAVSEPFANHCTTVSVKAGTGQAHVAAAGQGASCCSTRCTTAGAAGGVGQSQGSGCGSTCAVCCGIPGIRNMQHFHNAKRSTDETTGHAWRKHLRNYCECGTKSSRPAPSRCSNVHHHRCCPELGGAAE